jgi:tripartite-type tricarboxylate transporter receptor subunit TctC
MPEEPVARLSAAVRAALEDAAVRHRLAEMDLEPMPGTPASVQRSVETDSAVWGDFIRRRGLRVE